MKLRTVLMFAAMASVVAFSSCKKEEKKEPNKPNTPEVTTVTSATIAGTYKGKIDNAGDDVNVMVTADGDNVKITLDQNFAAQPFKLEKTENGVTKLTFTATDDVPEASASYKDADKSLELSVKKKGEEKAKVFKGTKQQ